MTPNSGLFAQLVSLAKSDHVISDQEHEFILQMARMLNINKQEFEAAIHGNVTVTTPKTEFDRILQFYRLYLMARIDQEISPEEILFLKNTGLKFGLPPEATNELLNQMNTHSPAPIDENTLAALFTKHYN